MDAQQVSQLSNYSIFSLLVVILREIANRLGIPVSPVQHVEVDTEAGLHQRGATANPVNCFHVCSVTGCDNWCQLDFAHTRHLCAYHSWE